MGAFISLEIREKVVGFYRDTDMTIVDISDILMMGKSTISRILREFIDPDEYLCLKTKKRFLGHGAEPPSSPGLKWCNSCKKELEISEFYYKSGKYLLNRYSRCKKCLLGIQRNCKVRSATDYFYSRTPKAKYGKYKSSSKKRNIVFDLTINEFMKYWEQPCSYCGREISTIGLDRIDSLFGYTKDNIVSCCSVCNDMKGVLSVSEFLENCRKIIAHSNF